MERKSNTPTLPRHIPIFSNPTADFELIFNLILTQGDCRGRDHHSINLLGFFIFLGLLATRVTKPSMKIVTAHLHKFLLQVFLPSVHSAWIKCHESVAGGVTEERKRDHKWIGGMRYLTADTVPSLINSLGQNDCINVFIASGAPGSSFAGTTHTPLLGVSNLLEEIDRVIALSDQCIIPTEEGGGGRVGKID